MNEHCIANIGPRERRRRLNFGLVVFALTVAGSAGLVGLGVPRAARLIVFPAFWGAAAGFFQYREKT